MAKVINMTLDPSSVADAIKELKSYEKWVKQRALDLIDAMCDKGEKYAIAHVGHIDTGATVASIIGYRDGDKGLILASGNVKNGVCTAVWIEFGTGVYRNGGGYPHPKAAELGMSPIGTYGQGKGANPNGWWYYDASGKLKHTRGIKAQMFMYDTAKYLRENVPLIASEVFK